MPLPLQLWAELVTRDVRAHMPDAHAVRAGSRVTWTLGTRSATVKAARPGIRWLAAGALTYCETPDAQLPRVAVSNVLTHFDARCCRGIDHETYSDTEIKRIEGEARQLRAAL